MVRSRISLAVLLAAVVASGCAATHQARSTKPAGFLGDYSELREGEGDEALLVFLAPDAAWDDYDSVQIDPIVLWKGDGTDLDADDAKAMVDYLDAAMRRSLEKSYRIVERPGAGVLRLRIAITEAESSWPLLDAVSTIVPQPRALSALKRVATGSAAFVGKAGIEGEVLDSLTNRRLFAAVDRRVGQKRLKGAFSSWDDARGAFDFWAERLHARLAELRGEGAAS